MFIPYKKALLSTVVCGVVLGTTALHADNGSIVNSIMKLRADVESLYSQIDDNKEAYKAELKSYTMQSTDNEAQINRQETAIKMADAEIKDANQKVTELSNKNDSIAPLLLSALDALESSVKSGIPFKKEQRLADIAKLRTELNNGDITEEKALSLIWASYDDQVRLTKEIGLFKQDITVDGETKLAKIAKLGSVMLYFATPDDQVGYLQKDKNGYSYKVATDEADRKKIVALFDALQKQIRTGYFSLPNALVLTESK